MKMSRRLLGIFLTLVLMFAFPVSALAQSYDISVGSVTITGAADGQTVTQENNNDAQGVRDDTPVVYDTDNEIFNRINLDTTNGDTNVTIDGITAEKILVSATIRRR